MNRTQLYLDAILSNIKETKVMGCHSFESLAVGMKNFTPQGVIRTAEERLSCGLLPTIQFACDGVALRGGNKNYVECKMTTNSVYMVGPTLVAKWLFVITNGESVWTEDMSFTIISNKPICIHPDLLRTTPNLVKAPRLKCITISTDELLTYYGIDPTTIRCVTHVVGQGPQTGNTKSMEEAALNNAELLFNNAAAIMLDSSTSMDTVFQLLDGVRQTIGCEPKIDIKLIDRIGNPHIWGHGEQRCRRRSCTGHDRRHLATRQTSTRTITILCPTRRAWETFW